MVHPTHRSCCAGRRSRGPRSTSSRSRAIPRSARVVGHGRRNVRQRSTRPRSTLLPPGTYYWGVTPMDAQGHRGAPSPVQSFTWTWPTSTAARVATCSRRRRCSIRCSRGIRSPARRGTSSRSTRPSTSRRARRSAARGPVIGTSLRADGRLPGQHVLLARARTRRIGNAGVWNRGPDVHEDIRQGAAVTAPEHQEPAHARQPVRSGERRRRGTPGYQTQRARAHVGPGAGRVQLRGRRHALSSGGICDWSGSGGHWRVKTACRLGAARLGLDGVKPYSDPMAGRATGPSLVAGKAYCARVRARSDRDNANGGLRRLHLRRRRHRSGVQVVGHPTGGACTPTCMRGYLGANDYVLPADGTLTTRNAVLHLAAARGQGRATSSSSRRTPPSATSSTTRSPRCRPTRRAARPSRRPTPTRRPLLLGRPAGDELERQRRGRRPAGGRRPQLPEAVDPADADAPRPARSVSGQPTFRWTLGRGCPPLPGPGLPGSDVRHDPRRRAHGLHGVHEQTPSYPADTVLYWRVRADDENLVGLTWSASEHSGAGSPRRC